MCVKMLMILRRCEKGLGQSCYDVLSLDSKDRKIYHLKDFVARTCGISMKMHPECENQGSNT